METRRTLPIKLPGLIVCAATLLMCIVLIASCSFGGRPSVSQSEGASDNNGNQAQRPTFTPTPTATDLPWPTFEVPLGTDPTPAPPMAERVGLPEGAKVWLLLGAEGEKPIRGRTNAIHIVVVNERLSKASIISIPGNTFVYLPGQGMGRINTAYPLGGMKLVSDTLVYNFGLRPDRFVVAHETEFIWLVDDLGGVEVSVLLPIRDDCGGLAAGLHSMDGKKALCYVSHKGDDEVQQTRRQQQVLQLLFTKLVQLGRMARLPVMYASYDQNLDTDVSLMDLILRIPLALRLGDPDRVKSFVLGWGELESWELPDLTRTSVLLPKEGKILQLVNQAVEAIRDPSALNAVVLTYEMQLTEVIGWTRTLEVNQTMAAQPTATPSALATQPGLATATPVPTGQTPLPTSSPTRTLAPTQPAVPTPTSDIPYPIPTVIFFTETPAYP